MIVESNFTAIAQEICISNNYTFLNACGGGSFKRVFKIENNEGDFLALKIIIDHNPSPRVIREMESLAICDSSLISKIVRTGTIKFKSVEYLFIIEEFLAGGNVTDLIASTRIFDSSFIKGFGLQLLFAIKHISGKGLVHRDIKPDNIMFRNDQQEPVLVDFGTVKDLFATSLTQTWAPRAPGTPYFSSPEQLNNEKNLTDWRSDQFSLGVVFVLLITGFHPYQLDNEKIYETSTVQRVAEKKSPNLSIIEKSITHGFKCIDKMVQPWPFQRYRNIDDLIDCWNKQEV
jgi:serine/threonine protein kinase